MKQNVRNTILFLGAVLLLVPLVFIAIKDNENIYEFVKTPQLLKETLAKIGIKNAIAKLLEETASGSAFECHEAAHTIGRFGYQIFKEKSFEQCDTSCHSGCYHGAMEGFLSEKGTENLATNIDGICGLFDTRFAKFQCLHGVGHGILAYTSYDMPEALRECKKLKTNFSQVSCFGGVFMENILTGKGLGARKGVGKADHITTWVNQTDPYYPCNKVDQNYDVQYQCYQMQTSWMLSMNNYNFDEVAKECEKAPKSYRSVCFKSFGRDAGAHTLRNAQKIVELCNKVPRINDYYDQCIEGAVDVVIDFYGTDLKKQGGEICKLLDENEKGKCYFVIAKRLLDIFKNPEDQAAVCNTFEDRFRCIPSRN